MDKRSLELAEVFHRYGAGYRKAYSISLEQERIMRDVTSCRTAALGAHRERCDRCGHERISYNSCRNRHCPKCQGPARAKWLAEREAELLPVPYFHLVFTLPDTLAPICLQNKRVLYGILFGATSRTLTTIARDPKHLGAEIGFFAILHTWGQNLLAHPHLHCVVPGGGLSEDRMSWVASKRKNFFLPVRVLSRLFRRLFLEDLGAAFQAGELAFHGSLSHLSDPGAFDAFLQDEHRKEWVVHAKPPFGGPQVVLRYLARYANRVALSNDRLLSIENGKVTFSWKDYRDGHQRKSMTVDAVEFIRRFLLHLVPDRFVRIRHFGLFANRHRARNLALCKKLLAQSLDPATPSPESPTPALAQEPSFPEQPPCPRCGKGHMAFVERLLPTALAAYLLAAAVDTS